MANFFVQMVYYFWLSCQIDCGLHFCLASLFTPNSILNMVNVFSLHLLSYRHPKWNESWYTTAQKSDNTACPRDSSFSGACVCDCVFVKDTTVLYYTVLVCKSACVPVCLWRTQHCTVLYVCVCLHVCTCGCVHVRLCARAPVLENARRSGSLTHSPLTNLSPLHSSN